MTREGLIAGLSIIGLSTLFPDTALPGLIAQVALMILGAVILTVLFTAEPEEEAAWYRSLPVLLRGIKVDLEMSIGRVMTLASMYRADGPKGLSRLDIGYPYLKRTCDMIAEGASAETISRALTEEMRGVEYRHKAVQALWLQAAIIAPAFALVAAAGHAVAVMWGLESFLLSSSSLTRSATLLVSGTALGLVFLWVTLRLKTITRLELREMALIRIGVEGMLRDMNLMHLEEVLRSRLPTHARSLPLGSYRRRQIAPPRAECRQ